MNNQNNLTSVLCKSLFIDSINYAILRNYHTLPNSTGGSDIDVLITNSDFIYFYDLLKSFNENNNIEIVSVIKNRRSIKICLLNANFGVQIDVFFDSVYFGSKEIIPIKVLLENTFEYNGLKVLNPSLSSLLSFLKELLNNRNCDEKYIYNLQNQYLNQEIPSNYLINFGAKFHSLINSQLNHLNNRHIDKLYILATRCFNKSLFDDIYYKMSRFLYRPGFTIAFIGTDGSGKSTLINKIKQPLLEAFHNEVYFEHQRPNKFPSIARLLRSQQVDFNIVTDPHSRPSSAFLGSLFRWGYYMLDYTLGFYLKVWPKNAIRSSVWIFDRYYYDYIIDPKRSRINLPKWLLKFGQYFIPEPDLILCLGTSAEIIYNRKPELSLDEINRQVEALKEFSLNNKRAVWIDTGQNVDESTLETLSAVVNMMKIRFKNFDLIQ